MVPNANWLSSNIPFLHCMPCSFLDQGEDKLNSEYIYIFLTCRDPRPRSQWLIWFTLYSIAYALHVLRLTDSKHVFLYIYESLYLYFRHQQSSIIHLKRIIFFPIICRQKVTPPFERANNFISDKYTHYYNILNHSREISI